VGGVTAGEAGQGCWAAVAAGTGPGLGVAMVSIPCSAVWRRGRLPRLTDLPLHCQNGTSCSSSLLRGTRWRMATRSAACSWRCRSMAVAPAANASRFGEFGQACPDGCGIERLGASVAAVGVEVVQQGEAVAVQDQGAAGGVRGAGLAVGDASRGVLLRPAPPGDGRRLRRMTCHRRRAEMLARCLAAVGGALEEHAVVASLAGHREAELADELRVVGELAVGEGQGIEGEEVLLGHEHAGDPEGGEAAGEQAREAVGRRGPTKCRPRGPRCPPLPSVRPSASGRRRRRWGRTGLKG